MKPLILITSFVLLFRSSHGGQTESKDLHPDAGLSMVEMVQRNGYPIEVYEDIRTGDGYLITIHRIPHGRNNSDAVGERPVVLLMHCLMCSSAVWITYGPDNGLAFILADLGYDVWMPSARGTTFSKKHVELDPVEDKEQFWRFSWHEIGYYDVPRSIDFIIERTGVYNMFYVGFSQGTTSFYVMASELPEYNDKIRLSVSLAPIAYMSNLENTFYQVVSRYLDEIDLVLDLIGWYEFFPNLEFMDELVEYCENQGREFCDNLFFIIFGQNAEEMEENWLPVFATHLPAGASSRQFIHYGQGIQSAKFRRYDHGLVGNLNEYGTINPPEYDTTRITAPTALIYSENDDNAAIVDVMQLAGEMPNVVYTHLVENPRFGHSDFVFHVDVVDLVYRHVVELFERY